MKIPLQLCCSTSIRKALLPAFLIGYYTSIAQSVEILPTSASISNESSTNELVLRSFSVPNIIGFRFGGTAASPTAPPGNSPLFQINAGGFNGSAFTTSKASISLSATEPWTPTANGTRVSFGTTANGTTDINTKMVLNHNGFVGIGTLEPQSRLHLYQGDAGTSPSANAQLFIESNEHTYINMATPNTKESGVLFGKTSFGYASGGIIYDSDRNLQFRTSTNDTRMIVSETGNVGIGTTTPGTKLAVVGDVSVSLIVTSPTSSITYNPFNRQNNSYHALNTQEGNTVTIRGFTAAPNGTLLYLIVAGDGTAVIKDNDSTETANRILTNIKADIVINGLGCVTFIYTEGWRVLSFVK